MTTIIINNDDTFRMWYYLSRQYKVKGVFFFPVSKVAVCWCLYILFTKAAVTRWNLCATTLRKKLSASSLPCNIKSIHFFQNVETGLEVLFFPALLLCTITMNCVQLVASFPDLLIEQGNKTNFMKYHLCNHHA